MNRLPESRTERNRRSSARLLCVCGILVVCPPAAAPVRAQTLQQSKLTPADADSSMRFSLEDLARDPRWLGLSPRDVRWAPDGSRIFFRWRLDPQPGQDSARDPWYAADKDGRHATKVASAAIAGIPASDAVWSADRKVAAWSRGGTLYTWSAKAGTRAVYGQEARLGDVAITTDGARVTFSAAGARRGGGPGGAALWQYSPGTGVVREVAAVIHEPAPPSRNAAWLHQQQMALFGTFRRDADRVRVSDSIQAREDRTPVQLIPLEHGTAFHLTLSADGRFVSFMWRSGNPGATPTVYASFVNPEGATEARRARPKVGDPLAQYRMGVVRVSPDTPADSVRITWVDPGVDRPTIVQGPFWAPAGHDAAVEIYSMDHKDRWIARLDPATGHTTALFLEHQKDWVGGPLIGGSYAMDAGYLQWLPDGSGIGFVSEKTGWPMLYLADTNGQVRQLTHGAWEIHSAALTPDGRTWVLGGSETDPNQNQVFELPAHGGDLHRITNRPGWYTPLLSPDGTRIAALYETSYLMPDLYVLQRRPQATESRVTRSGTDAFYRYPWIRSRIATVTNPTGDTIWIRIWQQPKTPNRAAVVFVHGCGPCARAVDDRWDKFYADLYANYMYQKGYTTATVDYLGSSGHGHAYMAAVYQSAGTPDVDSALPLVHLLITQYGIDPHRIGIYGGSYGGFFTLMSLFRHPHVYAAGVALYPVTDWAHYNQGYTRLIMGTTPEQSPDVYRRTSPIYYADSLQDALQIQHGLIDDNVQIQDTFRLIQRLMELHETFDLAVYPLEHHGWTDRWGPGWAHADTRLDSYRRMTRWFDEHLLGKIDPGG